MKQQAGKETGPLDALATLSFVDARDLDPGGLWTRLVDQSPDAWFWNTVTNAKFNLEAARPLAPANLSFVVMLDQQPVGLAPLFAEKVGPKAALIHAAAYGGPLPWPCFVPGLSRAVDIEDATFAELERRARAAGCGRIRFRLSPPSTTESHAHRFAHVALTRKYLDASHASHVVQINTHTLSHVRERYRRYHRKFSPAYDLGVLEGADVDARAEEAYFKLHVLDAGGQYRSRDSYRLQADLARNGEAFYVVARRKADNQVVGMLLVSVFKNAAYDNSVAVHPDFQDEYVSHLLKWKAVETLLSRGVATYELGEKSGLPAWGRLTSEKTRGISHFKEGWARGNQRTVMVADKFLTSEFLEFSLRTQLGPLANALGLCEDMPTP